MALSLFKQVTIKRPPILSPARSNGIQERPNTINYANALRNLGRLKEAKTHCERAIALKPDYADALNNLSNILNELNKPREAEANARQALSYASNHAPAYNNLGVSLFNQRKFNEAADCYDRAIALNPRMIDAHINLGNLNVKRGRVDEALALFERAASIDPSNANARYYVAAMQILRAPMAEWKTIAQRYLAGGQPSPVQKLEILVNLAIHYWAQDELASLYDTLTACVLISDNLGDVPLKNVDSLRAYVDYLAKLHAYASSRPIGSTVTQQLAVIGDSHSLGYVDSHLDYQGSTYAAKPHLIIGCKAWHLAQKTPNQFLWSFDNILKRLTPFTPVYLVFGEIDCRFNEGILRHVKKQGVDLRANIEACVRPYVRNAVGRSAKRNLNVSFVNVPAPNLDYLCAHEKDFTSTDAPLLIDTIRMFNEVLKEEATRQGCSVIDVYALTVSPDGSSNGQHHIDGYHHKSEILALAKSI